MKCLSSKEFTKCNIPDIAEKIGVSIGYLSSIIKKETGKTIKYWIDERILCDAKTALTNSDTAIEILAEELGFNTTSNFSNFFKAKTNLSPSEYRTKYKFFLDDQS
jgi:AraC-like DNA-binding protein